MLKLVNTTAYIIVGIMGAGGDVWADDTDGTTEAERPTVQRSAEKLPDSLLKANKPHWALPSLGVVAGIQRSSLGDISEPISDGTTARLYARWPIRETQKFEFAGRLSLSFSDRGANNVMVAGVNTGDLRMRYLGLAGFVEGRWRRKHVSPYLLFGLTFEYLESAERIATNNIFEEARSQFETQDYGWTVGIGIEWHRLTIDLRHQRSWRNIRKFTEINKTNITALMIGTRWGRTSYSKLESGDLPKLERKLVAENRELRGRLKKKEKEFVVLSQAKDNIQGELNDTNMQLENVKKARKGLEEVQDAIRDQDEDEAEVINPDNRRRIIEMLPGALDGCPFWKEDKQGPWKSDGCPGMVSVRLDDFDSTQEFLPAYLRYHRDATVYLAIHSSETRPFRKRQMTQALSNRVRTLYEEAWDDRLDATRKRGGAKKQSRLVVFACSDTLFQEHVEGLMRAKGHDDLGPRPRERAMRREWQKKKDEYKRVEAVVKKSEQRVVIHFGDANAQESQLCSSFGPSISPVRSAAPASIP